MSGKTALQKKTFTKWLNFHLRKVDTEVKDLFVDLRDGQVLFQLIKVFSGKRLAYERGKTRLHYVANLNQALKHFRRDGVHLVNIDSSDIVDGNETLTLGLVWALIRRYQVSSAGAGGDDSEGSSKAALIQWCQERTRDYDSVQINNLTTTWSNGLAFCALIHAHRPDLLAFNDLQDHKSEENLHTAFTLAEEHFGVPKLLDPSDVNSSLVDEKVVFVYISHLKDALSSMMADPGSLKIVVPSSSGSSAGTDLLERSRTHQIDTKTLHCWAQEQAALFKQQSSVANLSLKELRGRQQALSKFLTDEYKLKDSMRYQLEMEGGELIRCGVLDATPPTAVERLTAVWNILKHQIEQYRSKLNKALKEREEQVKEQARQLNNALVWIDKKKGEFSRDDFATDIQSLVKLMLQSENFCQVEKAQWEEAARVILMSTDVPSQSLANGNDSCSWQLALENAFLELTATHANYRRKLQDAMWSCEERIFSSSKELLVWARAKHDYFKEQQAHLPESHESLKSLKEEFVNGYLAEERKTMNTKKELVDSDLAIVASQDAGNAEQYKAELTSSFQQLDEAEANFRTALEAALGHLTQQEEEDKGDKEDDQFSDVNSLMSWAETRRQYLHETASLLHKESVQDLEELKREHLEEMCISVRVKRKEMIAALSKLIESNDKETQNMAEQMESVYQSLQSANDDFAKALQAEIDRREGDKREEDAAGIARELLEWIEERTAFLQRRVFPVNDRTMLEKLFRNHKQFQESEWVDRCSEKNFSLSILELHPRHSKLVGELWYLWKNLESENEAYCLSLQNAFLQLQLLEDDQREAENLLRTSSDLLSWTEGSINHFQERSFPASRIELEVLQDQLVEFEMNVLVHKAERKQAVELAVAQRDAASEFRHHSYNNGHQTRSLSPGLLGKLHASVSTLDIAWQRMECEKAEYTAALEQVLSKEEPLALTPMEAPAVTSEEAPAVKSVEVENLELNNKPFEMIELPDDTTFCDLIVHVWFKHQHSIVPF